MPEKEDEFTCFDLLIEQKKESKRYDTEMDVFVPYNSTTKDNNVTPLTPRLQKKYSPVTRMQNKTNLSVLAYILNKERMEEKWQCKGSFYSI